MGMHTVHSYSFLAHHAIARARCGPRPLPQLSALGSSPVVPLLHLSSWIQCAGLFPSRSAAPFVFFCVLLPAAPALSPAAFIRCCAGGPRRGAGSPARGGCKLWTTPAAYTPFFPPPPPLPLSAPWHLRGIGFARRALRRRPRRTRILSVAIAVAGSCPLSCMSRECR